MSLLAVEILLVEDHAPDAELTLHALRQNHMANRVYVAKDGEEALDFIFCRGRHANRSFMTPPKLILLDLHLPGLGGLELLRILKTDPRTRQIPVIILTSSREEHDRVASDQLGVNGFVTKPVDFAELREVIGQMGMYWLLVDASPAACFSSQGEGQPS